MAEQHRTMSTGNEFVELFHQLLSHSSETERQAQLDRISVEKPEAAQKLMAMLDAAGTGSFLEKPSPLVNGLNNEVQFHPGQLIGSYSLTERIGVGGMGEVWLARQIKHLDRVVAIKLIKPGLNINAVLQRFAVEQQSLARMSHPGISQILDAGTTEQHYPYFVMEYVDGKHITDYCALHKLGISQRLQLFSQLCIAVQYAHQSGIVHRDLKPANILVAQAGGSPLVKVIDFGLAKLVETDALDATVSNSFERVWGTPLYASPEVLGRSDTPIDSRCDVYSLGIILYELLCGTHPVVDQQERRLPAPHLVELMLQRTPKPPSCHWKTIDPLDSAAQSFPESAHRIRRRLLGDLDSIVMKAIAREPLDRYATVSELATDLELHTNGFEVRARKPSLAYSVGKLAVRHRGIAGATFACALLILIGTASTLWQATIARHERDRAIEQSRRADVQALAEKQRAADLESVSRFQSLMLSNMNAPNAGKQLVNNIVSRFEKVLRRDGEMTQADQEKLRVLKAELMASGPTDLALSFFEESLIDPSLPLLDKNVRDPKVRISILKQFVYMYQKMSRFEKSQKMQESILELVKSTYGDDSVDAYSAMGVLGNQLFLQSKWNEAADVLKRAVEGLQRTAGTSDKRTLRAMADYAMILRPTGNYEEQKRAVDEVLQLINDKFSDERKTKLDVLNSYGLMLREQKRNTEAQQVLEQTLQESRELLGDEHRETLNSLNNLGAFYLSINLRQQAEPILREGLEKCKSILGEENSETITVMINLGNLLVAEKKLDEAIPILEEAVQTSRKILKDTHAKTHSAMSVLTRAYAAAGRYDDAEKLARQRLVILETNKSSITDKAMANVRLASVLRQRESWEESEKLLLKAHDDLKQNRARLNELSQCIDELVALYSERSMPNEEAKWQAAKNELNSTQ